MTNMRRDPRTGRMVSEEDFVRMSGRQTMFVPPPDPIEEEPTEPEPPFEPYRVWTAGRGMTQEKIFINGQSGLRPMYDGAYYVTNRKQEESLKRALGQRFWKDNVPEGEPDPKCDTCGWHCRSYAAMLFHANNAHGRPQAGTVR
jgi:hypothetical protein